MIFADASRAVELAASNSYGRLIAFLSAQSGDLSAVEDALAVAFQVALTTWPQTGVPDKPEAWLLVTAKRRLIDVARRSRLHDETLPTLTVMAEQANEPLVSGPIPDERLKLLFVCAHPAIDAAARTPLMLQTVLGLDAARIASAFLVKPSTMGQRLTRAKAKIRDAGIPFEVPENSELPERLEAVLEAIYATYGTGWGEVSDAQLSARGLADEAIELGRVLLQQLPTEPEVQGLLALMLYCDARRDARTATNGRYVPLAEQDPTRWRWPLLSEAHQLLLSAEKASRTGRFQLEAAIQSAHTRRAFTGQTDWEEIALLYEGLVQLAPTLGALVGRAAAAAEARSAATGWSLLESIQEESVKSYQPYWALSGYLLQKLGRNKEAALAYTHAIGLCENAPMREFLVNRAATL